MIAEDGVKAEAVNVEADVVDVVVEERVEA